MAALSTLCSLTHMPAVQALPKRFSTPSLVVGTRFSPRHLALAQHSNSRTRKAGRICMHRNESSQTTRAVSRVIETASAPDVTDGLQRVAGCVTLALDGTSNSKEALQWTLQNLTNPGDTMQLVHIVFDQRINTVAVGASDTGRVSVASLDAADFEMHFAIQDFEGRLEGEARKMVDSTFTPVVEQSSVPYQISLPLRTGARSAAAIGEAICSEAQSSSARVLVVASHGPGMQAEYGSVARYCCTHSPVPLVVLPADVMTKCGTSAPIIMAACKTAEELRASIPWLMTNAARPGDKLSVVRLCESGSPPKDVEFDQELAVLQQTLGLKDIDVQRLEVPSGSTPAAGAAALATELCRLTEQVQATVTFMERSLVEANRGGNDDAGGVSVSRKQPHCAPSAAN